MSFTKRWFSDEVTSTDGYRVKIVDRATILYKDNLGRLYVSAEKLATKNAWALYPSDMRMSSIRGKQLQDEGRRSIVVQRIGAVFDFLEWRLDVS